MRTDKTKSDQCTSGGSKEAKTKTMKFFLEKCHTYVRPYISESGPTNKGPTANASKYICLE